MKTMPKVYDRVWVWSIAESNTKIKGTVTDVNYDGVYGATRFSLDAPRSGHWLFHYSQLNRLVKKPRKCEECAKPKQLFYVYHEDPIDSYEAITGYSSPKNGCRSTHVSTLALISTEEVKK